MLQRVKPRHVQRAHRKGSQRGKMPYVLFHFGSQRSLHLRSKAASSRLRAARLQAARLQAACCRLQGARRRRAQTAAAHPRQTGPHLEVKAEASRQRSHAEGRRIYVNVFPSSAHTHDHTHTHTQTRPRTHIQVLCEARVLLSKVRTASLRFMPTNQASSQSIRRQSEFCASLVRNPV